MREIKFRAWDKVNECWVYETLKSICSAVYFNDTSALNLPNVACDDEMIEIYCLYTGLKDKNGKEIYEGDYVVLTERENIGTFNVPDDIIANNGYTGREDIYKGKIIYQDCGFGIDDKKNGFLFLQCSEDGFFEIIGNIYENPELLT